MTLIPSREAFHWLRSLLYFVALQRNSEWSLAFFLPPPQTVQRSDVAAFRLSGDKAQKI